MEAHVDIVPLSFFLRIYALPSAERAQASEGDSMPERMANKAKDKSSGAADEASNRLGPKADAATDKARNVASNTQSGAQQSSGGCSHAHQGPVCTGNYPAIVPALLHLAEARQ